MNAPRVRTVALCVMAVMVVAACSSDSEGGGTTTSSTSVDTTPVTDETTTTSSTTTLPPTTSSSSTSTSTSTTSTSSTSTTTTISPIVDALELREDGIGSATFGADPDGVVAYINAILGPPSNDTGWVDPFTFAACPGDEVRSITWGALSLLFTDNSDVATARRHFFSYEYGLAGELGEPPVGLHTANGIGRGSRIVDLKAVYPGVFLNPSTEEGFPASFYVSDNFRGLITGVGDDDVVTTIFGGIGCGE